MNKDLQAMTVNTGRRAYEASVRLMPTYHDGTPRKTWDQLSRAVQIGWETKRHTPPVHPEARFNLCTDP